MVAKGYSSRYLVGELLARPSLSTQRSHPALCHVPYVFLVGILYYSAHELGLLFQYPNVTITILNFPYAILLVALVLSPPKYWWMYLAGAFVAHLLTSPPRPLTWSFSSDVTNLARAIIAALGMRYLSRGSLNFDSLRKVMIFLAFGVLLAPAVAAGFGAAILVAYHASDDYWMSWCEWFLSNALTAIAFVPAMLIGILDGRTWLNRQTARKLTEAGLLAVGLLTICTFVFSRPPGFLAGVPVALYAPLPFLLWAVVRFGTRGTSYAVLAVTLLSVFGAVQGVGPFSGNSAGDNILTVQLFLIAMAIPLLLLGAVIAERSKAEEQFMKAFRSNPNAMMISRTKDGSIVDVNWRWQEMFGHAHNEAVTRALLTSTTLLKSQVWSFVDGPADRRRVSDLELPVPTKSGRILHVSLSADIEEIDSERCWIVSVRDISDRKRVENALRRSEERYRTMVESQGELVCRFQPDTTLTFVNEAYCRYFGQSREHLIGRKFIELIPESAREGVRKHVQSLIANPRSDMHEHQVTHSSGKIAWQQWTNFAIVGTDGTVHELQAIGRDITERREAEAALKEREERIQLAAESANLSLWVLDYEHGNSWMNDKGRSLYCLETNEPITREKLLALVHPADVFLVEAAIQRALDDQDTFEIEHRLVRPNDETRWLIVRGRCLRNGVGDVGELLGVTIDVTAQKQAALQVQAQREEMAYLSRLSMLGEMAGALAHELNQPLTAIVANAHAARNFLTRGQMEPAFLEELVEDMAEDGYRAGEIIRGIRALVRKAESIRKEVDLNSVIAEVLRLMHSDLLLRECTVETDCDPNLPSIQADPVQMQQVLLNLIANAIEAMQSVPAAQRRVLIHTLRPSDGMVLVRVRDFGVGIASVDSERMFQQFFSTKRDGMGLGLGIVRSIIEAHAGKLSAENAENGGAQFSFHLPIRAESLH